MSIRNRIPLAALGAAASALFFGACVDTSPSESKPAPAEQAAPAQGSNPHRNTAGAPVQLKGQDLQRLDQVLGGQLTAPVRRAQGKPAGLAKAAATPYYGSCPTSFDNSLSLSLIPSLSGSSNYTGDVYGWTYSGYNQVGCSDHNNASCLWYFEGCPTNGNYNIQARPTTTDHFRLVWNGSQGSRTAQALTSNDWFELSLRDASGNLMSTGTATITNEQPYQIWYKKDSDGSVWGWSSIGAGTTTFDFGLDRSVMVWVGPVNSSVMNLDQVQFN